MSKAETYTTYFDDEEDGYSLDVFVGSKIFISLNPDKADTISGVRCSASISELEDLRDSIDKAITAYHKLNPEDDELH